MLGVLFIGKLEQEMGMTCHFTVRNGRSKSQSEAVRGEVPRGGEPDVADSPHSHKE